MQAKTDSGLTFSKKVLLTLEHASHEHSFMGTYLFWHPYFKKRKMDCYNSRKNNYFFNDRS